MAERQFGPYRLVRQIAVGGMAEIHLAKTKGIAGFEKYCALKMIHPNFAEDEQFIQMLVDEAKIAVQLTHGNIAQTFDLGRVGETYYITMEYVDGADLYKLLRRASEQDLEMPLDVCAFIGKEIASALDHAHRKRDHAGKPLGIVHRDVSPQNVLVSYAGEVKLVDFGIAKATMKARQTAVGVIKGKYYYMSPEQAWGDPIDYRSDIFSAGIVIYEMITGQMLYLEEDLHKLLDMARKADIAPPSRLRKGVPPQLERIVMHALGKQAGDRYQSAGDLAADLERFLHTYAPVFTASKVAGLIRQVIGEQAQVPAAVDEQGFPSVEMRDGPNSTHPLDTADLVHEREEIRDENSVIFRVADLNPSRDAVRTPVARPVSSGRTPVPRTTRAADPLPLPPRAPTPPRPSPVAAAPRPAPRPSGTRPRQSDEETRPLVEPVPPNPNHTDDSGLLTPDGRKLDLAHWDQTDTHSGIGDSDLDLDNIGEHTMVTGRGAMGGFMMDVATEDGVDATLVTSGPPMPDEPAEDEPTHGRDDDDGPTQSRDFVPRVARSSKAPPPAALAAKIHAPAVSELRKPRPSRRTPPGGVPAQANVLQQIVGAQASEPMPVPRAESPRPPVPTPPSPMPSPSPLPLPPAAPPPPQFPSATPGPQAQYVHDASGLPMAIPTPPAGLPAAQTPPGMQPYAAVPGLPPGYPQAYPQQPYGQAPGLYPVSPGALYQMSPYGQPAPMPMTLTGQLRLSEVDEIPSQFKIHSGRRRWFAYVIAGLVAVSVAATSTFLVIRTTSDPEPTTGSVHIESVPPGADVYFNNTRLSDKTPLTVEGVPIGTSHDIRVELARHQPYAAMVDIPKTGGEVPVMALMKPITGKIVVDSQPSGAEVWVDGQNRGRTPKTITDIDMSSAKKIEIRLKDYQPFVTTLDWPSNGVISLNPKLLR